VLAELVEGPVGDVVDPLAVLVAPEAGDLCCTRHNHIFVWKTINGNEAELASLLNSNTESEILVLTIWEETEICMRCRQ
jgi:hypothetical protein